MSDNTPSQEAREAAELLPCPFCGGPAELRQNVDYRTGEFWLAYFVICGPCDLIREQAWGVERSEAIAAWNTRDTPPAALSAPPTDEVRAPREAFDRLDWLNLMPCEIVARVAFNEGCREKTAADIRAGLHSDVKIRAEVAVKLVGYIQTSARAALSGEGRG